MAKKQIELSDLDGYSWDWWAKYGDEVVKELTAAFSAALTFDFPDAPPAEVQRFAAQFAEHRGASLLKLDGPDNLVRLTRERVNVLVADTLANGESLGTLVKNLRADVAFSRTRAKMVARTECLPGETPVDGAVVRAIHRRWYSGPMVEVTTASGRKFSATPNHPIFTSRGWLASSEISEGDYLVCHLGQQDFGSAGNQDVKRPPATLREIFDSALAISIGERKRTTQPDFHGDGREGEVNILHPYRMLRVGQFSPLYKPIIYQFLSPADMIRAPVCRSCGRLLGITAEKCFCSIPYGDTPFSQSGVNQSPGYTQRGGYGNSALAMKITGRNHVKGNVMAIASPANAGSNHIPVSFAAGAHHSSMFKNLTHPFAIGMQDSGDPISSHAGAVELDRIIGIRTYAFSGHVYNLSTMYGYYTIGQGIITGNTATALGQGSKESAKMQGRDEKRWVTQGDDLVSPECRENEAAGWIPIADLFPGGVDTIPQHPNCLLPGNRIIAPKIISAYRVLYHGEAVELTTECGDELTITPNHMILTPLGFMKAKFLRQGDYIISSRNAQGIGAGIDPDNDHSPTPIEEIWDALMMSPRMNSCFVPTSPIDFHGDAGRFNGQVHIIYADSLLSKEGIHIPFPQHSSKNALHFRNPQTFNFSGFGPHFLLSDRMMATFTSSLSSKHQYPLFASGQVRHADEVGFAPGAGFDIGFQEMAAENLPAYTQLARQFILRFASLITMSQITKIRKFNFSGHVYDLQTSEQLYICNNVIVKNCRCNTRYRTKALHEEGIKPSRHKACGKLLIASKTPGKMWCRYCKEEV